MIRALVICSLIFSCVASHQKIKTAVVDIRQISLEPNSTLNFTLRSLDSRKTLMITLKDHKQVSLSPFQLQIENKDHEKAICNFIYATNLCVMEKSTGEVTIRVKCKEKACAATLIISQRLLVKVQAGQKFNKQLVTPGEVFRLPRRNFTSLLEIYSQRQQHKLLTQQIAIHSNIHAFRLEQIEELDSTSAVFGLKPVRTDADQYLFVESGKQGSQDLRLSLRTHAGLLHQSMALVDFVETFGRRSKNQYTYAGTLAHNVQVNLRIFAPRDNAKLPLALAIRGHNPNSEPVDIRRLHIPEVDFRGQKFYDLSFIVARSQHIKYSIISFQVVLEEVVDRAIFIEVEVRDTQNAEISIFDDIFFGMEKDEQIILVVEPHIRLTSAEGDKEVAVLINADEKYFASTQICSLLKGCQISIKAGKRCEFCSLRFDLSDETVRNHILYYEVLADKIEGKVQVDQELFFRYSMEGHSSVQIAVDSVNVILYASFDNYERCKVPKPNCHQYVVNQQNPMLITSTSQKPTELLLSVLGLEKTAFRVRFIKEINGLTLKLRQKFTYLFDDEDTQLTLKFILDRTALPSNCNHLSFNLVAPVGSLRLKVNNIDGVSLSSADGFLAFPMKNILGDNFQITVTKIGQFISDFIHMTLVIDTEGNTVRLDQTSTHYEKYVPGEQKKFLVEYDPFEVNALNIFTENLEKIHGSMSLRVREVRIGLQSEGKPLFTKILTRDMEFVNLDQQLQDQDACSEVNCELQVSIVNTGKRSHEQSITQLAAQSVIQLSDSIWSGYQINELTRTSHFYFVPRQFNRSTSIIFQTDDTHLYINYRIHNKSSSISPVDWPFQNSQTEVAGRISGSQIIDISAQDPEMQACWPTCVVLINVNQAHAPNQDIAKEHSLIQTYKILATNSIIELPQDTKLEFALGTGDEKSLFILVKNFLKVERFTFFTYFAVGRGRITASLVSGEKEFPLGPKGKDFMFDSLETPLQIYLINSLINSKDLNPEQTLLKITILAQSNMKLTIQFSSYLRDIYRLRMDDLEVATLRKGQQMWYQFIPERDFIIKFYRLKGFPFLKVARCEEQNYLDCLNKYKKLLQMQVQQKLQTEEVIKSDETIAINQAKKTQDLQVFVEKTYEVQGQFCERCIYFVWIYCFEGDLQLSVNVRTRYSEVQLKEMNIIDEHVEPQKHSRYLINADPLKQTVITIRILQGTAKVEAADSIQSLFNQTLNSSTDDYRDIIIEASEFYTSEEKNEKQAEQEQSNEGANRMPPNSIGQVRRPVSNTVLRHIHVTVTATSDQPVEFLMSYSVGQSRLYLEDGIVSQKRLVPELPHTFYYHNRERKSHAYLTLSSQIEPGYSENNPKNEMIARFYYYPDANNRKQRESFIPQLPPNRNQNYLGKTRTSVYELPSKFELMEVEVESSYYLRVTASINHKELIYLPLGFDYLIKLHPLESLHLVVNRPDSEYLQLKVKKCDQSMPSLYYTNDARQFKNGVFATEVDIQTSSFRQFIKTKPSSNTIHLKLIGDPVIDTLLIITVTAGLNQEQKQAVSHYRPGNKGLLNYQVLPSNKAEVRFKPILCDDKECVVPAVYYLLLADHVEDVFGELNCAGHYFVTQAKPLLARKRAEVMTIDDKHFDKITGEYRYLIKLTSSRAYLGVKAIVEDGSRQEIVYVPLEITSLWGELSKISLGVVMLAALALSVIITIVIVLSTRLARRGYRPISNQE